MFNIGPMELMLILLVALVVVGPKRLPEVGRTIGKSLREIRKVQDEVKSTMRFDLDDEKPSPRPTPRAATKPAVRPAASPEPEAPAPDAVVAVDEEQASEPVPVPPSETAAISDVAGASDPASDVSDVSAGKEPAE